MLRKILNDKKKQSKFVKGYYSNLDLDSPSMENHFRICDPLSSASIFQCHVKDCSIMVEALNLKNFENICGKLSEKHLKWFLCDFKSTMRIAQKSF